MCVCVHAYVRMYACVRACVRVVYIANPCHSAVPLVVSIGLGHLHSKAVRQGKCASVRPSASRCQDVSSSLLRWCTAALCCPGSQTQTLKSGRQEGLGEGQDQCSYGGGCHWKWSHLQAQEGKCYEVWEVKKISRYWELMKNTQRCLLLAVYGRADSA